MHRCDYVYVDYFEFDQLQNKKAHQADIYSRLFIFYLSNLSLLKETTDNYYLQQKDKTICYYEHGLDINDENLEVFKTKLFPNFKFKLRGSLVRNKQTEKRMISGYHRI